MDRNTFHQRRGSAPVLNTQDQRSLRHCNTIALKENNAKIPTPMKSHIRRINTQHFDYIPREDSAKKFTKQSSHQWQKWRVKKIGDSCQKHIRKNRIILQRKEKRILEFQFEKEVTEKRKQLMEIHNIKNSLAMARKKQAIMENLRIESTSKVSGYFDQMEKEISDQFLSIKGDILGKVNFMAKETA